MVGETVGPERVAMVGDNRGYEWLHRPLALVNALLIDYPQH